MDVATYRGEESIGELVDKLYVRLTPKQREQAEAALLKANPQLRKIKTLSKGSILRVPDLFNLRTKTVRNLENADAQIVDTVADALGEYSKRLDERFKSDNEATKTQIALLRSAKLKNALADSPDLQTLAGAVGKVLGTRLKTIGERQKDLETAIKQAQVNLKTRAG